MRRPARKADESLNATLDNLARLRKDVERLGEQKAYRSLVRLHHQAIRILGHTRSALKVSTLATPDHQIDMVARVLIETTELLRMIELRLP